MEGDNNPRPGTLLSESILYHETDDNKRNDSIDSEDFKQSDDSSIADCSKLSVGDRSGGGLSQNSGQRRGLVHSVSIVVEPANNMDDSDLDDQIQIAPTVPIERRKTIAGPIVVLEDFYFGLLFWFQLIIFSICLITIISSQTNQRRAKSTMTSCNLFS